MVLFHPLVGSQGIFFILIFTFFKSLVIAIEVAVRFVKILEVLRRSRVSTRDIIYRTASKGSM